MHAAPPVRVTIARSAGWAAFVATVWAAAVANVSAWALLRVGCSEAAAGVAALLLALASAAIAAARSWHGQVTGDLGWDGRVWLWRGEACRATVAVDAGSRLLLSIRTASGRALWVVVATAANAGDRAGLRAALYAHGSGDPEPVPLA